MSNLTVNYHLSILCEADLPRYSRIPIGFHVSSVFDVTDDPVLGVNLVERVLEEPWHKNYDAYDGEGPLSWSKRWTLTNWGFLGVEIDGELCGACALAYNTDGIDMLENRGDLAVLWDIRVHPNHRRAGVGGILFDEAVKWSRARKCWELKIETQNINVGACRFYQCQGCILSEVNRNVYSGFPEEIQLIWRKKL